MKLEEWLAQTKELLSTSRSKAMTDDTPTGQLRIAVRIIRRIAEATESMDAKERLLITGIAEDIINGKDY